MLLTLLAGLPSLLPALRAGTRPHHAGETASSTVATYRPSLPLRRHAGPMAVTIEPAAAAATTTEEGLAVTRIRAYFEAWNRRDMATACEQFDDECVYDDTQYAGAFSGKEALEKHLYRVADALPPTFQFCIDEVADNGSSVGVHWHVENNGQLMLFTRGCSLYKASPETGKLVYAWQSYRPPLPR